MTEKTKVKKFKENLEEITFTLFEKGSWLPLAGPIILGIGYATHPSFRWLVNEEKKPTTQSSCSAAYAIYHGIVSVPFYMLMLENALKKIKW